MEFGLSRAQLLELLANAMFIAPDRRSALLGRFQHLQRLAIVGGVNPGRGKAAKYSSQQVLVIAFAFQLLQVGMTPERAVQIVKENLSSFDTAIDLLLAGEGAYATFDPCVLSASNNGSNTDVALQSFVIMTRETLPDAIDIYFGGHDVEFPRIVIISLTSIFELICQFLDHGSGMPSSLAFKVALEERGNLGDS